MIRPLKLAVLPGDGIGKEVMYGAIEVLQTVIKYYNIILEITYADIGGTAIDYYGLALPHSTIKACGQANAILLGSVGGNKWESLPTTKQPERSALLSLRKKYLLFANIRTALLFTEIINTSPLRHINQGIDIICIRELTGGIYMAQPKSIRTLNNGESEAIDTSIYKTNEIKRIAEIAAKVAKNRKALVYSVDKANVLDTSVLWRKTVKTYFKKNYPNLELKNMYVDNAAMQLISNPNRFDVILTENMFGDILSDEIAIICGSLGMMSSASIGTTLNTYGFTLGIYEPAGGSAPDIAGKNIANPCAQILSVAKMLYISFGIYTISKLITTAVRSAILEGARTMDITSQNPSISTQEIIKYIKYNIVHGKYC